MLATIQTKEAGPAPRWGILVADRDVQDFEAAVSAVGTFDSALRRDSCEDQMVAVEHFGAAMVAGDICCWWFAVGSALGVEHHVVVVVECSHSSASPIMMIMAHTNRITPNVHKATPAAT